MDMAITNATALHSESTGQSYVAFEGMNKIVHLFHRLWWVLPCLAIPLSAWVHTKADLSFPVPWVDELVFIWPAQALSETGSIQTDSMNSDRAIWWHPPGYQVVLAGLFKLAEPGVNAGRWLSWFLMTGAYVGLMGMVIRNPVRAGATVVLTVLYISHHVTIAANITRPEALVIFMAVSAFWLLQSQRPWAGISVLVLCTLCHPVGVLFLAGAGLIIFRLYRFRPPWPTRMEWYFLSVTSITGVITAIILIQHLSLIQHDLLYSAKFLHVTWAWRIDQLLLPRNLIPALLFAGLTLDAVIRSSRGLVLAMLGFIFWTLEILRPEMWYSIYSALAYGMFSIVLLERIDEIAANRKQASRTFISIAALMLVLGGCYFQALITDPRHYPYYMWWRHMTIRDSVSYHTERDVNQTVEALKKNAVSNQLCRVRFYPQGEGVLYTGKLPDGFIPYYPVFTDIEPDVLVFRLSRLAYPGFNESVMDQLKMLEIDENRPFHTRNDTEKWYIHRVSK